MKKKILTILLNQYFISFISSVIIFLIIPDYFSKYKLELKEKTFISEKMRVYFPDLNSNGISEKIIAVIHENSSFMLDDDKGNLVDQWNFSETLFAYPNLCWFFDADEDGFKEIYAVTQKKDSIFLNIAVPYSKNGISRQIKKIFIDRIKKHNNKYYCIVSTPNISSYKTHGTKDLFFTINTGFACYPRNVYKYNFKTNEIKKSAHLTNNSIISEITDINQDGFDEIMFKSGSYGNERDSLYTEKSDYSLWLNVLDHHLNFLFKPIEIKVPFSRLKVVPYKQSKVYKLLCLLNSGQKQTSQSKLLVYSIKGNYIKEKYLKNGLYQIFLKSNNKGFLLFNTSNGLLTTLNLNLLKQSEEKLALNSELYKIDINKDGENEYLNVPLDKSKFTIYQENFKNGISFDFATNDLKRFLYGIKKSKTGNQLYIQTSNYYYIFDYHKNPLYFLKYLLFLGVFMGVLLFVHLILLGQKTRMEKQIAIEKKITELQLKTIKNQVDPHFVFNAINTISGLMLTDNKIKVDEFICNFSELMRSTLKNSDKITCTLQNEIDYVTKYIQLQQVRFNHSFEYQINVDKGINLLEIVPKHIIYTYVENAIKYALKGRKNGLLKIDIRESNKQIRIVIQDNGNGFDNALKTKQNSTGNGLLIMENIYNLYSKLYKKKISHELEEIKNEDKKVTGVKVVVNISK